jgi:ferritin
VRSTLLRRGSRALSRHSRLLHQEQAVTRAIHDLYRLASDSGDLASFPFLQSFIAEQNEEEATVETILERLRLAGGESSAILLLDSQLGARNG